MVFSDLTAFQLMFETTSLLEESKKHSVQALPSEVAQFGSSILTHLLRLDDQ